MILIFYIAGPVTIVTSIAACCCLCFCRKRQDEQAPKPTVRNVQYVQQQRPVAQPTVHYVQPTPQQYAPQRYQPVSHAVVVQPHAAFVNLTTNNFPQMIPGAQFTTGSSPRP